jgi:stress response protein SCP2
MDSFGISMNTKGALDLSDMSSLNNLYTKGTNNYTDMNSMYSNQQQGYSQPTYQQNYNSMSSQNTGYQQQQPVQNNYNQSSYNNQSNKYVQQTQQSYQQQNYNSNTNNSYTQPQQQYRQQPVQNTYTQQQQPVQQKQRAQSTGNGVHLKKGQKVALVQAGQQLGTIRVCLGWDVVNQQCDLDASAFMLGADGKVVGDDWFVFYGQTTSPDGSVSHSGDSQGEGDGDDEIITIHTDRVSNQVQKITFVVTINEALTLGLNFSMVQNAYVRVVDSTNKELARFSLTDYYANVTSMVVGELYRYNGTWKFNAVGDGVAKDLEGLCGMYGVNVAD